MALGNFTKNNPKTTKPILNEHTNCALFVVLVSSIKINENPIRPNINVHVV